MNKRPHILRVETGLISPSGIDQESSADILDYHVYARVPRWWRRLEELLRLDLYLALRAKSVESRYDIIWAGSEKVGIPLSFLGIQKPLVVIAHHVESPLRAKFVRATGIARKWAGIGYISNENREFFINDLGVPARRLFQYESAKYLHKAAIAKTATDGPIMSAGVAKRDYPTLISALAELEGYETELFISSKFGDKLTHRIDGNVPAWVRFMDFTPEDELMRHYQRARFVVVPLERTTHNGAGVNVVLEAGSSGKAVVATKTGGMSTFVKDGETGILVPPHDAQALRNAIQKLWMEPDLACEMGLAGRRYMEAHFDPEVVNSNISAFLDQTYADVQKKGDFN